MGTQNPEEWGIELINLMTKFYLFFMVCFSWQLRQCHTDQISLPRLGARKRA